MRDIIELDAYVVDALMRDLVGHDRRPAAYLVYLSIRRIAAERAVPLSHQQLADRTGLSKRAVQDAVAHLLRRRLLSVERRARTEPALVRALSPWMR